MTRLSSIVVVSMDISPLGLSFIWSAMIFDTNTEALSMSVDTYVLIPDVYLSVARVQEGDDLVDDGPVS